MRAQRRQRHPRSPPRRTPRPPRRHPFIDAANLISFARRRCAATFACLRRTISPRDVCARTSFGSSSWAPCYPPPTLRAPVRRRSGRPARCTFACATAAADCCRTFFSLPLPPALSPDCFPYVSVTATVDGSAAKKKNDVRSEGKPARTSPRAHTFTRAHSPIVLGSRVQAKELDRVSSKMADQDFTAARMSSTSS